MTIRSKAACNRGDGVRIFVGVRIATAITAELRQRAGSLRWSGIRFLAPADVHLTLVPPWDEHSLPEAIDKLNRVTSGFSALSLTFQHLGYGPQPRQPRLLWAECAANADITKLRAALLQAYGQADGQPFRPHVTLARIRRNGRAIAREHPIDQFLCLSQPVTSIELFRSPARGETGYQVLASAPLGAGLDVNQSAPVPGSGRTPPQATRSV
ncbi:MAG TPA: RNA 2',3'-cyclic phosphodiesterase [Xanthobacteraceae bacterium]|jgi:2'-5' RNA ligase